MTSSIVKGAKSLNQKLFPQFESIKQGRLAKVFDLFRDYKNVFKDIIDLINKRRLATTTLVATTTGLVYCGYNNPDMQSYKTLLLDSLNEHTLISDLIRNKQSHNSLLTLRKYYNEKRLVYMNFGICSLLFLSPYSESYDKVEKHTKDIQRRWISKSDWKETFLDIGFLNRWYYLEKIMLDYDVNHDEFDSNNET